MNVDDQLCLAEFRLQTLVLSRQPFVLIGQRVLWLRFPAASLGRQARQDSFLTLLLPRAQVGRVEPLSPQQLAQCPPLRTGVCLRQNPQLVLRREPSPSRLSETSGLGISRSVPSDRWSSIQHSPPSPSPLINQEAGVSFMLAQRAEEEKKMRERKMVFGVVARTA